MDLCECLAFFFFGDFFDVLDFFLIICWSSSFKRCPRGVSESPTSWTLSRAWSSTSSVPSPTKSYQMSAKVTQKYSIIHIWNLLSNGASSVGSAPFFELVLLLPIPLEAVVLHSTRLLRFATDPSAIDHTTHTLTMYVQSWWPNRWESAAKILHYSWQRGMVDWQGLKETRSADGRTNYKKLNGKSTSKR